MKKAPTSSAASMRRRSSGEYWNSGHHVGGGDPSLTSRLCSRSYMDHTSKASKSHQASTIEHQVSLVCEGVLTVARSELSPAGLTECASTLSPSSSALSASVSLSMNGFMSNGNSSPYHSTSSAESPKKSSDRATYGKERQHTLLDPP